MPRVAGVSFRKVGKVYYFDPGELELKEGEFVIAETARGIEFGEIVIEPKDITEEELVAPLKPIVRIASAEDLEKEASNRDREKNALEVCEQKVAQHNLPMKLLEAEISFDNSLITFSFSADGRIDFRELVKDVASALKARIQLHQIGVRDEARLIGGYGTCGRSLCCATFLSNFEPVSMKMAKDQSLFLNPAKFSGVCGKLMCCLRYEHENYKEAQLRMPNVGAILETEQGRVRVLDVNIISNELFVENEEGVQFQLPVYKVKLEGICRKHGSTCQLHEKGCFPLLANDVEIPPEVLEEQLRAELEDIPEELAVLADDYIAPAPFRQFKKQPPAPKPEPQKQEPPILTNVRFRDPVGSAAITEEDSEQNKENRPRNRFNNQRKQNKPHMKPGQQPKHKPNKPKPNQG
jgi:cell fate regulator YaaT (PSP1 superfamily)